MRKHIWYFGDMNVIVTAMRYKDHKSFLTRNSTKLGYWIYLGEL